MTEQGDDDGGSKAKDAPRENVISRRRLAYAAPMILVSRHLVYRASGCGKDHPTTYNCVKVPKGS